jgi:N-acetylmuramoyl-L-alanine amidase CwlA
LGAEEEDEEEEVVVTHAPPLSSSSSSSSSSTSSSSNLLPADVRSAKGWHEVDEISDELKRTHQELVDYHEGKKDLYQSLLSRSSVFLREHVPRLQQVEARNKIEKEFWNIHNEW